MANRNTYRQGDSGSSMESLELDLSQLSPFQLDAEKSSAHVRASTIDDIPMEHIDSSDDESMYGTKDMMEQDSHQQPPVKAKSKKSTTYQEMRARMKSMPLTLTEVSNVSELLTSPLSSEEDNATRRRASNSKRRTDNNGLRRSRCLKLNFSELLPFQDCVMDPAGAGTCTARKKAENLTREVSKLRDYLYIGDIKAAANVRKLKANGITHIVNLAGATCANAAEGQFAYLTLSPKDCESEDLSCLFLPIAAFIDSAREVGGKVLVHCYRGISRSCAAALSYIMLDEGKSFCSAWCELTTVRPVASPNRGFMSALASLEKWQQYGSNSHRIWDVQVHGDHVALMKRVASIPHPTTARNKVLVLEGAARAGIQVFRGSDVTEGSWSAIVPVIDRFMEQIEKNHRYYPCEVTSGCMRVAERVDEWQMMKWQHLAQPV